MNHDNILNYIPKLETIKNDLQNTPEYEEIVSSLDNLITRCQALAKPKADFSLIGSIDFRVVSVPQNILSIITKPYVVVKQTYEDELSKKETSKPEELFASEDTSEELVVPNIEEDVKKHDMDVEETPVVEDTPVVEESVLEPTPVQTDFIPTIPQMEAPEVAEVVEETPVTNEMPVVNENPIVVETPVVEEIPSTKYQRTLTSKIRAIAVTSTFVDSIRRKESVASQNDLSGLINLFHEQAMLRDQIDSADTIEARQAMQDRINAIEMELTTCPYSESEKQEAKVLGYDQYRQTVSQPIVSNDNQLETLAM